MSFKVTRINNVNICPSISGSKAIRPSTPFILSLWFDRSASSRLTTVGNIPFALSLSKGERGEVLRTGLLKHERRTDAPFDKLMVRANG